MRITPRLAVGMAAAVLGALALAACSGTTALTLARTSRSTPCASSCNALSLPLVFGSPAPTPTADAALAAYRALVHARVSQLETDASAIDSCGEDLSKASDLQACRRAVETLMHDARDARSAVTASAPDSAVDTSQKLSDALDLLVQGCIHDDQAMTSTAMFVWLPGTTTVSALNQLVGIDDDLQMG